jgi:hypothetical protein
MQEVTWVRAGGAKRGTIRACVTLAAALLAFKVAIGEPSSWTLVETSIVEQHGVGRIELAAQTGFL